MPIRKSTRHQKIIGELGEHLICNWLSRSGFEVARVDHTGIDLIACDPDEDKRIGITVKSRTRIPGTEGTSVRIFGIGDREKLVSACKAFGCEPWIGIYVETFSYADLFLVSLAAYEQAFSIEGRLPTTWRMRRAYLQRYANDANIWQLRIHFEPRRWKWNRDGPVTNVKKYLGRLIEILPEDADLTDVIYELSLMHSLEQRLANADHEPGIPHEEVLAHLREKLGIDFDGQS
jgi:Holliday junction resolvase-like predicted endonuclease